MRQPPRAKPAKALACLPYTRGAVSPLARFLPSVYPALWGGIKEKAQRHECLFWHSEEEKMGGRGYLKIRISSSLALLPGKRGLPLAISVGWMKCVVNSLSRGVCGHLASSIMITSKNATGRPDVNRRRVVS